jgi:hypothetical protein
MKRESNRETRFGAIGDSPDAVNGDASLSQEKPPARAPEQSQADQTPDLANLY